MNENKIMNIDIVIAAIKRFGPKTQTMIAIEEMSELTKELIKSIRGRNNRPEIVEELADVMICIAQVQLIHGIQDAELTDMINFKLERLAKLLEGTDPNVWKS